MARSYFNNLDLVRFAAALWVVGYHYVFVGRYREGLYTADPNALAADIFRSGYLGVCVFFVLSGFLIAHVSEGTRFTRFVVARVCRLMPAFWVCLALSTLIMIFFGASNGQQVEPISLLQGAANFTLLPQLFGFEFVDGVYWTLVYEFIFYGWASLFLAVGLLHRSLLAIVAGWLLLSVLNASFFGSSTIERVFITHYSGAFAAGLLIWHIRRHGASTAPLVLVLCAIYCLSFGVVEMASQDYVPANYAGIDLAWALAASAFSVAIVAAALVLPSSARLAKKGAVLGALSYPLYLIHQELGYLALRVLPWLEAPVIAAVIMCWFMIGVAWAIQRFAEQPLRRAFNSASAPMVKLIETLFDRVLGGMKANSKLA